MDFFIFKTVDGILLGFVLYLIYLKNSFVANGILLLSIVVYVYVVYNNYKILKEGEGF
ncbi:MAG: hypothetical protein J7K98_02835 [Candidatus Aenigmarchaeota archaeon]|nr:hypothetical protein [Candidatus Aenigmarchaeota archaeon]